MVDDLKYFVVDFHPDQPMASRARSKRHRSSRKMIPIKAQIRRDGASLDQFHPAKLILERDRFLSEQQLAYLLEKSAGKSLPPWLNRYLVISCVEK